MADRALGRVSVQAPTEDQIRRNLTLLYVFTAALEGATPEQRRQLQALVEDIKTKPYRELARRCFEIRGEGWVPSDRWLEAWLALSPKHQLPT